MMEKTKDNKKLATKRTIRRPKPISLKEPAQKIELAQAVGGTMGHGAGWGTGNG